MSARWVLPVCGGPIRDGILRLRGGRIEAVGPVGQIPPATAHDDLGEVAILPGLVNAHCHLELSGLRGRLPRRRPMTQWLLALLRARGQRDFAADAAAGAAELLAHGCTSMADISHDNGVWPALAGSPLRKVCFAEVLGLGPLAVGAMRRLRRSLNNVRPDERLRFGVSPHAPYTTSLRLYRDAIRFARGQGMPITTHLAETPHERTFLLRGTGVLARFMDRTGLLAGTARAPGVGPIEFARRVGLLEAGALLAHVNYLDDAELAVLATSPCSVAYCPRSSEFFGRRGHRYAEMLARGINVCLGTDSLASNDSLDMLEEMRAVWRQGQLPADEILRMATLNGAHALGLADQVGTLEPGWQADWIAVGPCNADSDPMSAILSGQAKVQRVAIAGEDVS